MALIVEDGTGLANAESYLSVVDADTYWSNRNNLDWEAADTADKEKALREATQYIDGQYDFVGSISVSTQALSWPRSGAVDSEGRDIVSNVVPRPVEEACAELALIALTERLVPALDRGGAVKREKVGSLEVEYQDGASPRKTYPFVDRLLRGLTRSTFSNNRRLLRA